MCVCKYIRQLPPVIIPLPSLPTRIVYAHKLQINGSNEEEIALLLPAALAVDVLDDYGA